jgi:hypothetical protein
VTPGGTADPLAGLNLRRGGAALRSSRWWARPLRVRAGQWWPRVLTAGARVLPDFVIIGAQRAGTTSLFEYLAAHPQVLPSLKKEVHFFDENWSKGPRWYRAHFPTGGELRERRARTGGLVLTGEGSPNYLFDPESPARAAGLLRETRFLLLLRNPVDRAFSQYQMNARKGHEPLDFPAAVAAEPARLAAAERTEGHDRAMAVRRAAYLGRGVYAEQVARWCDAVGRERLLILRSEQFLREPGRVMERVQAFLGLAVYHPADYPRYHDSGGARMPEETRRRLIEHFAPHNERLFALLGERWDWD